jgi:hypothetical protein
MPPKLHFIHRLFFCTRFSWLLLGIGLLEREDERGSIDIGRGREGFGTRYCGIRDSAGLSDMMSPSVSIADWVDTTLGSNDSGDHCTIVEIMFSVET